MRHALALALIFTGLAAGCLGDGGPEAGPSATGGPIPAEPRVGAASSTGAIPAARPPRHDGAVEWDGPDVAVSPGPLFPGEEQTLTEPTVAIDPTDPRRVVLVAIDRSPANADPAVYATNRVFRSEDAGATWTDLGPVPHPGGHLDSGDPVALFDREGTLYLASLLDPPDEYRYLYVFRSRDAGLTWEPPGTAFRPERTGEGPTQECTSTDKEWLALGDQPGELYLTASSSRFVCLLDDDALQGSGEAFAIQQTGITLTRSADGGRTWSTPSPVWDGYALGSQAREEPDGTLHVAFWAVTDSTTTGCVSAPGVLLARISPGPFPAIVVARSGDGGRSWSYHHQSTCTFEFASEVKPGVFVGGDTLPSFARDASTGALVVAYPTFRPAEQRFTVEAIRSSDGGRTWSGPVEATPAPIEAHLPSLHAADGVVRLLYVSNHEDGHGNTWIAESRDGGATWSEPRLVSSAPQDLEPDPDIGDYVWLDQAGGRIAAAWADARGGPVAVRVRSGSLLQSGEGAAG